jgi:hypothetical protein
MNTTPTRRLLLSYPYGELDVTVPADTDLNGPFKAHCNDTGETIRANGWLISSVEEITE